jgi:hypothetical protein
MRAMRRSMKVYALGAVVAAALTTTACQSSGDKKADDKTSPPVSAPTKTGGAADASSASPGGSDGKATTTPADANKPTPAKGRYAYANRQTPPTGSVCDHGGQGPYGSIESVNFGGESPNTVVGITLGSYECAQPGEASPVLTPNSATGAASDVLLDDAHLKVVVGGELASKLGTKTPTAAKFVARLAKMQDEGKLKGKNAPEFYFRLDSPSSDVNTTPDDSTHIIYLYQLINPT